MSKSNIVLALLAGAAIGGIIAIILKAENALTAEDEEGERGESKLELIAKQFSEKISSELKTAENKIKSAVKGVSSLDINNGEQGVYL